jgi:hypothetical protein
MLRLHPFYQLVQRIIAAAVLVTLFGLAFGSSTASAQTSACPAGAINVRPGDNLQALVDANAAGAAFCLQAGTYTRMAIVPKDGQQFIANGAVTFDGAGVTEIAFNGVLQPNNPGANRENIVIRGITFINYRTNQPLARSVLIPDAGWIIENVVIRDSTSGIRGGNVNWSCANNFILRDTLIENISHAALYWNATNGLTERVIVRNSGSGIPRQDANWYGVVKYQNQGIWSDGSFSRTVNCPAEAGKQLIVQDSTFERLNSVGWWCDINCRDVVFRRNVVRENYWSGYMFEISGGGHTGGTSNIVENNTFICNRRGETSGGAWGGAEIFIANGNGVIVRNNDITVCDNSRAFSFVFEQWRTVPTRDILIENNVVRVQNAPVYNGGTAMKNVITVTYLEQGNGGRNINFRGNRYFVQDTNAEYFEWAGRYNWTRWQPMIGDNGTFANLSGAPVGPTLAPTTVAPTSVAQNPTPTVATTSVPPSALLPYRGTPSAIPGRIQAEDFDLGGLGVGYSDTTPGNAGGAAYRTDTTDVDIKPNTAGTHTVGWYELNEWMQYTVNVAQAGNYDIVVAGGSPDANRQIAITFNGTPITGAITVAQNPNWDTIGTVTVRNVALAAGQTVMRITNTTGFLDLDYVEFVRSGAPTATTVAQLPTATLVPPTATVVVPTATPIPNAPALRAAPAQSSFVAGSPANVDFVLDQPGMVAGGGVRALEANCAITPIGIITGNAITPGTLFAPNPLVINSGFRPDGTFTFAISQTQENAAISTGGTVFTLNTTALTNGVAQLACTVTIIDGNRTETPFAYTPGSITVAAPATATTVAVVPTNTAIPPTAVQPTATVVVPTATLVPTATAVPPTATLPPTATFVPTATLVPTATATTAPQNGGISGTVTRSHGQPQGITINLLLNGAVIATTTTGDGGAFSLTGIAPGIYVIRAEAAGHLHAEGSVTVTAGQVVGKTPIELPAGDIVASAPAVIDELDVVQLAISYGTAETGTQRVEDLDDNGRIGLGDLGAIAENLRDTGPIAWN